MPRRKKVNVEKFSSGEKSGPVLQTSISESIPGTESPINIRQKDQENIKQAAVEQESLEPSPKKQQKQIFGLKVKNVAMAGKLVQGSVGENRFEVQFDEDGISEPISKEVFDKLTKCGYEPYD